MTQLTSFSLITMTQVNNFSLVSMTQVNNFSLVSMPQVTNFSLFHGSAQNGNQFFAGNVDWTPARDKYPLVAWNIFVRFVDEI